MQSSKTLIRQFADANIFYLEQWMALLVGIACLAASLWSAFAGHKEFPLQHLVSFSKGAVVSIGWLLTMAVGILGVTLTRFAFYRPAQKPEVNAKPESDPAKRLQLTVSNQGRS